jgi:hypothetical protein
LERHQRHVVVVQAVESPFGWPCVRHGSGMLYGIMGIGKEKTSREGATNLHKLEKARAEDVHQILVRDRRRYDTWLDDSYRRRRVSRPLTRGHIGKVGNYKKKKQRPHAYLDQKMHLQRCLREYVVIGITERSVQSQRDALQYALTGRAVLIKLDNVSRQGALRVLRGYGDAFCAEEVILERERRRIAFVPS